jgi:hypothetical protein
MKTNINNHFSILKITLVLIFFFFNLILIIDRRNVDLKFFYNLLYTDIHYYEKNFLKNEINFIQGKIHEISNATQNYKTNEINIINFDLLIEEIGLLKYLLYPIKISTENKYTLTISNSQIGTNCGKIVTNMVNHEGYYICLKP